MQTFTIFPNSQQVVLGTNQPTKMFFQLQINDQIGEHWIVPEVFPECKGYVGVFGATRKRRMWYFRNVNIWGPMVIVDRLNRVSLEEVQAQCRWA